MKITHLEIKGAYLVELDVYGDDRGYFLESYNHKEYVNNGIAADFVQDNRSLSGLGVLRGLHYQIEHPIGHLVYVLRGSIFDVGLDLRKDSPTFGKHIGITLSASEHRQIYLPPGVAHGFCGLSEENEILYKCTEYYYPDDEAGILWNDPALKIDWPVREPLINSRDKNFPLLAELDSAFLPKAST